MTILFGRVWIPLGAILYVAFAALQAHSHPLWTLAPLLGSPVLLVLVWRKTTHSDHRATSADPDALLAMRAAFSGALLWLSARAGPEGHSAFDAVANLGAGTSTLGALIALARITSPGGLLVPVKITRSLDAAVFAGFLWSIATTLPVIRATVEDSVLRIDPITVDYATIVASFSSILLVLAATLRLHWYRRLELGVADRCNGALSTAMTALLLGVPAALLDIGAPDRSVPAVLVAMAIVQCWIATTPDATRVVRWLRGAIAILALGAPVTLLAFVVLRRNPSYADWLVFAVAAWSVVVGVAARNVAKSLEPEQSRWLVAIEKACLAALEPEPSDALRAALNELSRLGLSAKSRSELWNIDPPEVRFVDVAGNLHERVAVLPDNLPDLAAAEPEQTLRLEVLRAVQVRRADVRPLVSWLENQGTFCATLLESETGALGMLCLPSAGRRSALALEEAQSLRRLAARLAALLAIGAAQARSRQRELTAISNAQAIGERLEQVEQLTSLELDGHRQVPLAMARAIQHSCYAPLAKFALEQVQRLARSTLNQALILPLGGDAHGWAAVAHAASPRNNGPFVVVDPVQTPDYPKPWNTLADRERVAVSGNVAFIDPAALPFDAQQAIANWLAGMPADSNSSVGCIAVVRSPMAILVTAGRVHESFARRFVDAETQIPKLADRGEDMRALVLGKVARLGLSLFGEPRAVDPAVLAELLNYEWPGNELELDNILQLLVQRAAASVITMGDLEQINLHRLRVEEPTITPRPAATGHRPPNRSIHQRTR